MPVVAASLACNTIKRYKNLSLMRNPRHLGTSDIEKLYDKLRYSKFVKEHSSSGIFSSLFQLKSSSFTSSLARSPMWGSE
uniref:Uncharacterized protein n=1 Tax=Oryza glumipatula TaxID=40148 RepID=A0A0E0B1C0_9ORYZ